MCCDDANRSTFNIDNNTWTDEWRLDDVTIMTLSVALLCTGDFMANTNDDANEYGYLPRTKFLNLPTSN
jgi:hypothetical protein